MKALNKQTGKILEILLSKFGEDLEYLKIESGGYMPLVIEKLGRETLIEGKVHQNLSLAHYGEMNGDVMRDPEMCFYYTKDMEFKPYYFRNDYLGFEQWSVEYGPSGEIKSEYLGRQSEHVQYASSWMKILRLNGFLSP